MAPPRPGPGPIGPGIPSPYKSGFTGSGRRCITPPVFTHRIMAPPVFVELLHRYLFGHYQFSET
jgi:hypothetical protein